MTAQEARSMTNKVIQTKLDAFEQLKIGGIAVKYFIDGKIMDAIEHGKSSIFFSIEAFISATNAPMMDLTEMIELADSICDWYRYTGFNVKTKLMDSALQNNALCDNVIIEW